MAVIRRLLKRNIEKIGEDEYLGWSLRGLQKSRIFQDNSILDIVIHSIRPNRDKGNHYHLKKTEWFIPIKGKAILRWRDSNSENVEELEISGEDLSNYEQDFFEVYEIEPDTCHRVMNKSSKEFVLIAISTKDFNPKDNLKCRIIV